MQTLICSLKVCIGYDRINIIEHSLLSRMKKCQETWDSLFTSSDSSIAWQWYIQSTDKDFQILNKSPHNPAHITYNLFNFVVGRGIFSFADRQCLSYFVILVSEGVYEHSVYLLCTFCNQNIHIMIYLV